MSCRANELYDCSRIENPFRWHRWKCISSNICMYIYIYIIKTSILRDFVSLSDFTIYNIKSSFVKE